MNITSAMQSKWAKEEAERGSRLIEISNFLPPSLCDLSMRICGFNDIKYSIIFDHNIR